MVALHLYLGDGRTLRLHGWGDEAFMVLILLVVFFGWSCFPSLLVEGVTFVIGARGGRAWRASLSLLMGGGREVFIIVDVLLDG